MASTCLRDELILQTSSFFIELHHWVFATCCEYRTLSSYLERHLQCCFRAFFSSKCRQTSTALWHIVPHGQPLRDSSMISVSGLCNSLFLPPRASARLPRTDLQQRQCCLGFSTTCCARTPDGKSLL